jgi:GNAT superfamily N-acetyltransferase
MSEIEYRRGDLLVSTDKTLLDVALIHDFLSRSSYWAQGRPLAIVQKSIQHSLCFGMYVAASQEGGGPRQVGFARVVTDYATYAWLCDVFILESQRGHGLGKWLIECVVDHPDLCDLRRLYLATRDAHELYRKYGGFDNIQNPERLMVRTRG